MVDKLISMFFVNKLMVQKYYNFWGTYGKFLKWTAYGLYTLGALELFILAYWYCSNRNRDDDIREANSPVAGGSGINSAGFVRPVINPPQPPQPSSSTVRAPHRRLAIFRGPYGDVDLPAFNDVPAMEAYIRRHLNLSQMYLEEGNENLMNYHSTLLLFSHPDPMEYLRLQSAFMSRNIYRLVERSLTQMMDMMENQLREEEEEEEE